MRRTGRGARRRALWAVVAVGGLVVAAGCRPGGEPGEAVPLAEGESAPGAAPAEREVQPELPPDDPDAPGCLPAAGALDEWLKVSPVRVLDRTEAEGSGDPESAILVRAAEAGFDAVRLARAEYRFSGGGQCPQATLAAIEFGSPEDAWGFVGVMHGGRSAVSDEVAARRRGDVVQWYASRGVWGFVLTVACPEGEPPRRACRDLIGRALLATPSAPLPAWIDSLLEVAPPDGPVWFCRSTRALVMADAEAPVRDSDRVDRLLGLGESAGMVVMRVGRADLDRPDYVWAVRYADAGAAEAAAERFRAALAEQRLSPQRAVTGAETLSLIAEPVGPYLCGSFTAEQESEVHLLPAVVARVRGGA